jgi:rod shape determining protein RodA
MVKREMSLMQYKNVWSDNLIDAFDVKNRALQELVDQIIISQEAKDTFGSYLAIGIAAIFFWQVCINIGMVLGLMPVVGIPLPLISYGGTSLLTSMTLIGILLNIHFRKQYF